MSKVSVLIPTYKPKKYIENCFSSLNNQTLSKDKFCVYIALNGTKEHFEDYILDKLKKVTFNYKYIYVNEPGVSNARNKLIKESFEEFIVFLDDDDLISSNYLENLLHVSSSKLMGISNIYNFEKNVSILKENYIGKTFKTLNKKETSKYKTRKYFSSPMAKMIHRDMVKNINFDKALSKGEDSLFMTMISKNIVGVHKTKDDTYYFVYERENSSSRKKLNINLEIRRVFYLIFQYMKLLVKKDYNKLFIFTRILASIKIIFNLVLKR